MVDALVHEHAGWIDIRRARLAARLDPDIDGPRPRVLHLAALDETWPVDYHRAGAMRAGPGRITLDARLDEAAIRRHLLGWLRQRADNGLLPRLDGLAAGNGLAYGRVTWRNQTSRWGSCSARGNLSLNLRLLFVAPRLAGYVLVHELCHTEHLNHGRDFWHRVAAIEPDYRALDRQLKAAWGNLPAWLDA